MMNEIIKERLALIQSGTVPKGYKKTKCGIYPENWTLTCMGNCIREYREISNNIQDIPVYSSSRNGLLPQSEYYDGKEATQTNIGYKVVPPNYLTYRHMSDDDVFHFNMNQTGGNILVSSEYPVFTVSDIAELGFILPMLNNAPRFKYFCGMQKLGGTRSRLYFKKLCEYQFYIPPLAEQKKIAEILEQCDKIISLKQEQLKEEKQKKQWMVENILTGKVRRGDFSDSWENTTIGNCSEYLVGYPFFSENFSDDGIRLIRGSNVKRGKLSWMPALTMYWPKDDKLNQFLLKCGDIVIAMDGALVGRSFAMIQSADTPSYLVQRVARIRSEINNLLVQWIGSEKFVRHIDSRKTSTAIPHITIHDILSFPIFIPKSKQEADVIENVLKMQDDLLYMLEEELAELKSRKVALMQLLLTGIVRVKP